MELVLMEIQHMLLQRRLATAANEDLGAARTFDGGFAGVPRAGFEMPLLLLGPGIAIAPPPLALLGVETPSKRFGAGSGWGRWVVDERGGRRRWREGRAGRER